MRALHPRLRLVLASTLVLSVFAIWWPDSGGTRPAVRAASVAHGGEAVGQIAQAPPTVTLSLEGAGARLPAQLASHQMASAAFDPFAGAQPPPAPAAASAPPPPKPFVGPLYQPPPDPPTLDYRYLGQMTDPAGKLTVYLAHADQTLPVTAGTRLDEGYVIESIASDGIHLYYPPLHVHTVIPVPPIGQDQAAAAANATALALRSASVP